MAKRKPTAGASAVAQMPGKVPQAHGGALFTGGVPGNRGGSKPSEFRALMMGDAIGARQELIRRLEHREPCKECGRKMSDADVMRWFDLAAKYGPGPSKGSLDPALVSEMAAAVLRHTDAGEEAMQAVYRDWALTLGRAAAGE